MVFDICLIPYFDFLMSWKFLFNSPKLSHTFFLSSIYFSFLFLFNSLFFSATSRCFCFRFSIRFLTWFSLISLKSSTSIGFCLKTYFVSYCVIVFWVLSQGNFQLFFILVRFENNVEIAFQIKTMPFSRAIYVWEDIGIKIRKNVLVAR